MIYKYADSIIKKPHDYESIEVHGVRDSLHQESGTETHIEIDNKNPQFFSVYVRLKEGCLDCVGDFSLRTDATDYAAEISKGYGFNWPIHNYTTDQTT
jgi:hypothetical protein